MSRVYISDTNIWIDFRNAGLLDELFELPFIFCCTDFVLDELNNFDHAALLERGLRVEQMDDTAVIKLFGLMTKHNNSSLADVSCYFLAQETARPLLTGDGRLRKQAQRDGTGSAWCAMAAGPAGGACAGFAQASGRLSRQHFAEECSSAPCRMPGPPPEMAWVSPEDKARAACVASAAGANWPFAVRE